MAKKQSKGSKQTTKRTRPPTTAGAGGGDPPQGPETVMDSAVEKNSAMAVDPFSTLKGSNPVLYDLLKQHDEIDRRRGLLSTTSEVKELASSVSHSLTRLRDLAIQARDLDARIVAGRYLADIVSRWLDRWPEDSIRSITPELFKVKTECIGFAQRWAEMHTKGRPRERGFAKKGETERTENEDLLSNFIWDIQHNANRLEERVLNRFLPSWERECKPLDAAGKRLLRFIKKVSLKPLHPSVVAMLPDYEQSSYEFLKSFRATKSKPDEWRTHLTGKFGDDPEVAKIWWNRAINDHFSDYWSIVIEPALDKKLFDAWARKQPFAREHDSLTKDMRPSELKKLPPWKPRFSDAKEKMKPILKEIMHPVLNQIFVY